MEPSPKRKAIRRGPDISRQGLLRDCAALFVGPGMLDVSPMPAQVRT